MALALKTNIIDVPSCFFVSTVNCVLLKYLIVTVISGNVVACNACIKIFPNKRLLHGVIVPV